MANEYDECQGAPVYPISVLLLLAFTTCVSALCGCFNDHLIKSESTTLYAFSIWLYLFGFILNLSHFLLKYLMLGTEPSFFEGYTGSGLVILFLNSVVGLFITAVYKYGDAVIKSLSSAVSTSILLILSSIMFQVKLRATSFLGCLLILVATFMYMTAIPAAKINKPISLKNLFEKEIHYSWSWRMRRISILKILVALAFLLLFTAQWYKPTVPQNVF